MIPVIPTWNEQSCSAEDCADYNWCEYCDQFIYWVTTYNRYMFLMTGKLGNPPHTNREAT